MSYRHESCVLGRPADSCPLRGYCDCRYDPPQAEAQAPARRPPRARHRHSREQLAELHPRKMRSERNPHFREERHDLYYGNEAQARAWERRLREADRADQDAAR